MAQHSSRLHRLLILLDTGSTQVTRLTAARQIGDIAKNHPQDLNSLLKKVSQYLRSKNWDTRVAAAHAIGSIAENVKHATLKELSEWIEKELSAVGVNDHVKEKMMMECSNYDFSSATALTFQSFDIAKVLKFGPPLLASVGQEYDLAMDNKNSAERLARQKQNLRRRLGMLFKFSSKLLDVCEQFMDVSDMIRDEDLVFQKTYSYGNGINQGYYASHSGQRADHKVANIIPKFYSKRLSARELNLLKRKSKVNAKDQSKGWTEEDEFELQQLQNSVTTKGAYQDTLSSNVKVESVDDDNLDQDDSGRWPFFQFVEQLIHDMFDPIWEVRHGSIMALREIFTHQAGSVGIYAPDLSIESVSELPIQEKLGALDPMEKRPRDNIDLDVEVEVCDVGPESKRLKVKDERDVHTSTMHLTGGLDFKQPSQEAEQLNGIFLMGSVKPDSDLQLDVKLPHEPKAESIEEKPVFQDQNSGLKREVPTIFPEDCKLMQLMKLGRYSCSKKWKFLQDCAIRFLCVLSLDRFGDYVSDQVVAPVRETCAQALGTVLKFMHPSLVHETLNKLLQMQYRHEWEVRHGSLLGIKYLVAVRLEMLPQLLHSVLPACKTGLEDADDDVRAVAAEALIPTAPTLILLHGRTLNSIVMLLWDILLDLDDLSPSTSSVMNLLSELYSQPEMLTNIFSSSGSQELNLNEVAQTGEDSASMKSEKNPYLLSSLAPRLWPFMRHNITSVRHSAIRTLEMLLEAGMKNYNNSVNDSFWPASILGDTLRIVFQNLLLESNEEILLCSDRVWRILLQSPVHDLETASRAYMSSWIHLATTPYGSPLDATKMFCPAVLPRKSQVRAAAKTRAVRNENFSGRSLNFDALIDNMLDKNGEAGINPSKMIVGADSEKSVTSTRVVTAKALGLLSSKLPEASIGFVIDPLWRDLTSLSGVQRQVAAMALSSWFKELGIKKFVGVASVADLFEGVKKWLLDLLQCTDASFPTKDTKMPYSELSRTYGKMRQEVSLLFGLVSSSGMFQSLLSTVKLDFETISVDDASKFASKIVSGNLPNHEVQENQVSDEIESTRQRLLSTAGYLKCVQGNLHVTVSSLIAAAVVWTSELPTRLNPIILPLMAAIKREQEEILQQKAAEALAELIFQCVARKPSPNDELIKNLCSLTCMDPCETPQAALLSSIDVLEEQTYGRTNVSINQKTKVQMLYSDEDRSRIEGFIGRRGSEFALKFLCEKFGSELFDSLPKLWDCLIEVINPKGQPVTNDREIREMIIGVKDPQLLISKIQVVRSIAPLVPETLKAKLLSLLPHIFECVRHSHVAVRLGASRCIASMAKSMTTSVMGPVIEKLIPMLGDFDSVCARQGAGMLVSLLVQDLGVELVPYAPLLVVPLLGCMGESEQVVRQSVTHSFAALVPLLPLARGVSPPEALSDSLSKNAEDAQFLKQLLDNSHIDDYKLLADLKVTLRRYQQEGINWLSFLKRFKLHGILCDDMGLGKTLQASAIVASDVAERQKSNSDRDLLSLIVCPSTLVGRWAYEIEKYVDSSQMTSLRYIGSAQERILLRKNFERFNVIITSYDVIRKDIDYLGQLSWNYCILDEGHIIKNSKSKITTAVKQLKAEHRLVLSGTPIQNNVLELWSLFDFLMPGFLGTERQFQTRYGKRLLAAKDPKCSAKDAEAGILAMEALHKQIMPFLLRRTKDEVLSDLPEKIVQDRYCDLSPIQLKLYEQFSGSDTRKEISTLVVGETPTSGEAPSVSPKASSHVFQAIQYLLKLCSHPLLVLGEKPPDTILKALSELMPESTNVVSDLHELHHSPKLVALQGILEECSIGFDSSGSEGVIGLGQHQMLIFAQHKALLDIIEKDLFQSHMKSVTYLRLDGSIEPEKRFDIVKVFNSDPTIDVLLLTTHVGGLGLNLTSADTLVFIEHDWNPMRDLQAMDRAHRLGQRKVVNVHRLIMRGTLEEKIMSLQKFKVSVANSVINAENASLKTMNTDQLLDLFTSANGSTKGPSHAKSSSSTLEDDTNNPSRGKGLKAILSGLEELWDQSQYTEEYNLKHFLAKLNG